MSTMWAFDPVRSGFLVLAAAGGLSVVLCSGCGPKGEPAYQPPAPPGSVSPSPPRSGAISRVESLDTSRNGHFEVQLGNRSLAVVEHFDQALLARGWRKVTPKSADDPGQRQWVSTGAKVGFTDGYEADWENPKTGESATLMLDQQAETPGVQHGDFEILPKGQKP